MDSPQYRVTDFEFSSCTDEYWWKQCGLWSFSKILLGKQSTQLLSNSSKLVICYRYCLIFLLCLFLEKMLWDIFNKAICILIAEKLHLMHNPLEVSVILFLLLFPGTQLHSVTSLQSNCSLGENFYGSR